LPLSHTSGVPGWQFPVAVSQVSAPLQTSPSSQSLSALQQRGMGWCWHPSWGSQLSAVHTTPSSQLSGVPLTQLPVAGSQVSVPSQTLPLSQFLRTWSQVWVATSQWSVVQALLSSQSASVLQQPAIGLKEHAPVAWSQLSTVQTSLSLQVTGMPGWHAPVERSQVSTPLHASLSSHWASELQQLVIGVLLHAFVASSQVSLVHTTPSSQLGGVPFRQAPVLGSHVSRPLQKTLSSQTTGCPLQVPPLQVSSVVHLL
jgi:hypothetical protein